MNKQIMKIIKKDKRFSFKGNKVIRREYGDVYIYDRKGNILKKTYAEGSTYVYDGKGKLLSRTFADGEKYIYAFGITIRVKEATDESRKYLRKLLNE